MRCLFCDKEGDLKNGMMCGASYFHHTCEDWFQNGKPASGCAYCHTELTRPEETVMWNGAYFHDKCEEQFVLDNMPRAEKAEQDLISVAISLAV